MVEDLECARGRAGEGTYDEIEAELVSERVGSESFKR